MRSLILFFFKYTFGAENKKIFCFLYSCFFLLSISEQTSAQGTWAAKTNFPGAGRNTAVAFTIGAKGYFGTGFGNAGVYFQDFWEYDPTLDTWTQKANFGGGVRGYAVGFSIGNFGYAGTGQDAAVKNNDFWKYDPAANTWSQVANFGGTARAIASGFSVGNFGYAGTGDDGTVQKKDFWKYDPAGNTWTQMGNFPGGVRSDLDRANFVIGNFAYWGTGANGWNDLWQYNPTTDAWTQKANFPGAGRYGATGFSLCGMGYLGLGTDGSGGYYNNYWQYDPVANSWSTISALPAIGRCDAPAFVVNNKAYLGTGYSLGNVFHNDWWEFSMGSSTTITATASSTTICAGNSVTLTASGGSSYTWSTGSSATSIIVSPTSSTSYSVMDTSSACGGSAMISIMVDVQPTVSISSGVTICSGSSAALAASGGGNYSWSTGATSSSIIVSPTATTSYSVSVTNSCGTSTASSSVIVTAKATAGISCQNVCSGSLATLTASGGGTYSWSTGSTNSSVSTSVPGTYSVIVSLGAGCSDTASCTVSVFANPLADAGPDVTISNGSSVTLTASGGINYSWNTGTSLAAIVVSPAITSTYTVLVSDVNGCSATDTVHVFIMNDTTDCSYSSPDQFLIPNAFSPNGDNENETLKLFFKNFSCISDYEFYIYDRWGEKVFEAINPISEWDGSYGEKKQNTAVFAYYMKATLLNGEQIIKKGNISLFR